MDARRPAAALLAVAFTTLVFISAGASYRTQNFVVEASTPELAEEIGRMAEHYRHDLAIQWLGAALPNWAQPCPIHAQVAPHLGAGGQTSFTFDHSEVFGWHMEIQGSHERLLDSVLPHEVTHTIFASHFRRPLPRWADEGACTTVEDISERSKQDRMLIVFLHTGRGIAFSQMFAMTDYPQDILPLYAQGYSLARFLIDQNGQRAFMTYLHDGMSSENWADATYKHYGYKNLSVLQDSWLEWVKQGSPLRSRTAAGAGDIASARNGGEHNLVVRAQSADRSPASGNRAYNSRNTPPTNAVADNGAAVGNTAEWSPVARSAAPQQLPDSATAATAPIRNGSVTIDAGVSTASATSTVSAASVSALSAGAPASSTAALDPSRKSVYGEGVGMIRRSADFRSDGQASGTPTAPSAAANVPAASLQPAAAAAPGDKPASTDRKILLQWSRQQ